ncbi:hypothetical protein [Nocardioides jensenii]|uniref:hypothetical protein n=1 Tax=Nocardioides jensenii TaxID=1843 RepID=UPI0008361C4B|nr:hypothetical protein [Nocardioides jensenii]
MSRALGALVAGLVLLALGACSSSDTEPEPVDDAAFVTELMHRDAALLNLLDVSLGKPLPGPLSATVDTARADAGARIETAADLLEESGEEIPVTVRDHGIDHGIEADAPELEGAPTEADIHGLEELDGDAFVTAFTDLLRTTSRTTKDAASYDGTDQPTAELAEAAERQSQDVLDALG